MATPGPTRENYQTLLGPRTAIQLIRHLQYEVKPSKYEQRTILLTNYRCHLLPVKIPLKLELSFNLLEISAVESSAPRKLLIATDAKKINLQIAPNEDEANIDEVIFTMFESLLNTFPDVPIERLIARVDIGPPARWKEFTERLEIVRRPSGMCGNFSAAYAFICDRMNLPYQEDVAWDVDTIYHAHETVELTLSDFEYLEPRLYGTIVASLRFNQYFTGLSLSSIKLGTDCLQEVLELMKVNSTIKDLSLSTTGIKQDFIQKLMTSFLANKHLALSSLDLSGNVLEDKGIANLCSSAGVIGKLTSLNISNCGLTGKAIGRLIDTCFHQSKQLTSLDISDNGLRDDLMNLQKNLLSQPNSLTSLKLSGTDCPVEQMLNALTQGCTATLVHLDLSRNPLKKSSKDMSISSSWRQFFSNASALQSVNLSSVKILPETVRQLFQGLASNAKISSVELNLSGNSLGQNGATVLETVLPTTHNIHTLDISDNAFDQSLSNVALALTRSIGYRKVSLGKNFASNKLKNIPKILDSVAQLLQAEASNIESLCLDDLRIRSDVTVILNALGTNIFLTELDISGNQMGDAGAHLLGKALQVNSKLTTVHWDGNGTTATGFTCLATSLTKNFTMKRMPIPVIDVTAALRNNQDKVIQALKKIDAILRRNQDPTNYSAEPSYRLQQSFLTGTSQQMVNRSKSDDFIGSQCYKVYLFEILDRLVSQIQDSIQFLQRFEQSNTEREEIESAIKLIKEEQAISRIFMELHKLSVSLESPGGAFYTKLESFQKEVQDLVGKQLQSTLSEAMKTLENLFPLTLRKQPFPNELKTTCKELCSLQTDALRETIVERMGSDLMRKTLDLQLIIFTQIVTFLVEELLKGLHAKLMTLSQICSQRQQAEDVTMNSSIVQRFSSLSREAKNKIGTVRQSMQTRMVRPKSMMFEGADGGGDLITDEVFEESPPPPPATSKPSADAVRAKSADTNPPNSLYNNKKQPASAGDISDLPVSPPLKNLRWNRPKREKNHAAKSVEGIYEKGTSWSDDEENDEEDDKESGKTENGQMPHQNENEDLNNNKEAEVSSKFKAVVLPGKTGFPVLPVPGKPINGRGGEFGRKTIHPPSKQQSSLSPPPGNSPFGVTESPRSPKVPLKKTSSGEKPLGKPPKPEEKPNRTSAASEEGTESTGKEQ